jgi:hypothetical protein
MKTFYCNIIGFFLAVCLEFAGTNASSQITNVSVLRSNADARAEFRRLHPTKDGLEWASSVVQNWKPPEPWPEAAKRREIFEHCAVVLRSAIDTNQMEIACGKLTNQPVSRIKLKQIEEMAISNLNEFGGLLNNPKLKSYVGIGYSADITTSTNVYYFHFLAQHPGQKR